MLVWIFLNISDILQKYLHWFFVEVDLKTLTSWLHRTFKINYLGIGKILYVTFCKLATQVQRFFKDPHNYLLTGVLPWEMKVFIIFQDKINIIDMSNIWADYIKKY